MILSPYASPSITAPPRTKYGQGRHTRPSSRPPAVELSAKNLRRLTPGSRLGQEHFGFWQATKPSKREATNRRRAANRVARRQWKVNAR